MKIVAVDIGGTSIKLGLSDENGNIEVFKEYDTESKKGGPYIVEKLIQIISEFEDFDAIGISTAGQVNSEEGYYYLCQWKYPQLYWNQIKKYFRGKI